MSRHRAVRNLRYDEEYDDFVQTDSDDDENDGNTGLRPKREDYYKRVGEHDDCYEEASTSEQSLSEQSIFDEECLQEATLMSCLSELQKHVGNSVRKHKLIEIISKHNCDFEACLNEALVCATNDGKSASKESPTEETVKETKLISCIEELQKHIGNKVPLYKLRRIVMKHNFDFDLSLKEVLDIIDEDAAVKNKSGHSSEANIGMKKADDGVKRANVGKKSSEETLVTAFNKMSTDKSSVNACKATVGSSSDRDASSKIRRDVRKPNLYIVIVGHVDAGKSTLIGHLLFKLGEVDKKLMHKYEQESKKIGKRSFQYAWILDETSEERSRGVTMDVGRRKFDVADKRIVLLDAPGHKDFIPNMITGATQADAALLVVDATPGEFETGFGTGGQTREHALLIRSLGILQMIVVVNKMDTVSWDRERFDEICNQLRTFLCKIGFREIDIIFVPCSGLRGENLTEPFQPSAEYNGWYKDDPLLEAIGKLLIPERATLCPFRMSINDVFKGPGSSVCVSGRVESGILRLGDKVMVQPCAQMASVKALNVDEQSGNTIEAGDSANVLLNPDIPNVAVGHVICDPNIPITVTEKFEAKIILFNITSPITVGYTAMLHSQNNICSVVVAKLVSTLNKSNGSILKTKPRMLSKNSSALVVLKVNYPICLERYRDVKELGRIMLRVDGVTVAAGMVTEIY